MHVVDPSHLNLPTNMITAKSPTDSLFIIGTKIELRRVCECIGVPESLIGYHELFGSFMIELEDPQQRQRFREFESTVNN